MFCFCHIFLYNVENIRSEEPISYGFIKYYNCELTYYKKYFSVIYKIYDKYIHRFNNSTVLGR